MKKINYLAFVMLLGLSVIFTGCDDEAQEPSQVNITTTNQGSDGNNIPNGVVTYNYSITVKGYCTCGPCKTDGLDGAIVTMNGQTKTTDKSGIVTFEGVPTGTASFYVEKSGFAAMNFTSTLMETINTDVNQTRAAATTVMLFKTDASVTGRIRGDWDNSANNIFPNPNNGADYNKPQSALVTVRLAIEPLPGAGGTYNSKFNGTGAVGAITNATFSETVIISDPELLNTNARFTIEDVPSVPSGSGFSVKLIMDDYENITVQNPYRVYFPTGSVTLGMSLECETSIPDTQLYATTARL